MTGTQVKPQTKNSCKAYFKNLKQVVKIQGKRFRACSSTKVLFLVWEPTIQKSLKRVPRSWRVWVNFKSFCQEIPSLLFHRRKCSVRKKGLTPYVYNFSKLVNFFFLLNKRSMSNLGYLCSFSRCMYIVKYRVIMEKYFSRMYSKFIVMRLCSHLIITLIKKKKKATCMVWEGIFWEILIKTSCHYMGF